jgi:hypothetical protein
MAVGCATLNNLLNPIHAIDGTGEKIAAAWDSSDQQCTVGGTAYPYQNRPAVPAAPQRPASPGNPPFKPEKPTEPTGNTTYYAGGTAHTVFWSNGNELKQILEQQLVDEYSRVHMQSQYDQYVQELNQYNTAISTYQDEVAKSQQNKMQYEKDIAKHEQEYAEYQANLPKYQARVDAEIKSIQDSINPNAPENWIGYVEGKYLIYKGKAK